MQTFGLFVAVGIAMAWLLTVTFVPAYIMMLPERIAGCALVPTVAGEDHDSPLARRLLRLGRLFVPVTPKQFSGHRGCRRPSPAGASRSSRSTTTRSDGSPPSHPIRVADRVLNEHFGGTYMAYLALPASNGDLSAEEFAQRLAERAQKRGAELAGEFPEAPRVFDSLAVEARPEARRRLWASIRCWIISTK